MLTELASMFTTGIHGSNTMYYELCFHQGAHRGHTKADSGRASVKGLFSHNSNKKEGTEGRKDRLNKLGGGRK